MGSQSGFRDSRLTQQEIASQVHYRLVETLAASERHYRELIETLSVPVFEVEADGRLRFVNNAWAEQLGYSKSDSGGRNICDLVDAAERDRVASCLHPSASGPPRGERTAEHVRFCSASGTSLIMNVSMVSITQERISGFLHDVTLQYEAQLALKRALDHAEAASRAKSHFLANMSHEIRTPIGVIMGFCESLAEDDLSHEEREQLLKRVQANGTHVLALIGDILDLARIEAGHLDVSTQPCDLRQLLDDVVATLQQQARSRPVDVRGEWTSTVPMLVHTDPMRLRQILLNLGGNALKFTAQGSVVIETETLGEGDGSILAIRVRDTGIGIESSRIPQLFEPFQQGDTSYARRFDGAGLGLSIACGLITKLGGDIEATSQVGIGSVFTVHLPRRVSAPWIFDERKGSAPVRHRARILLAEDNHDLQVLTDRIVSQMGLHLDVVGDGQAALDAVARQDAGAPYDLILMDMQMPGLDGYAATRQLRQNGHRGAVVALTAHAMKGDRERCLAVGCDDYLPKPVSRKDLRALIARHVGTGRLPDRSGRDVSEG